MWISEPMPVMTRIITDDSGSSRQREAAIVKSPEAIQREDASATIARARPASRRACATTATADTRERREHRRAGDAARDAPSTAAGRGRR